MKGFVKIEAIEDGLHCETHLSQVGMVDKLMLMKSMAEAINLSEDEFKFFVVMYHAGILDSGSTRITLDPEGMAAQMKQAREEEGKADEG